MHQEIANGLAYFSWRSDFIHLENLKKPLKDMFRLWDIILLEELVLCAFLYWKIVQERRWPSRQQKEHISYDSCCHQLIMYLALKTGSWNILMLKLYRVLVDHLKPKGYCQQWTLLKAKYSAFGTFCFWNYMNMIAVNRAYHLCPACLFFGTS